MREWRSCWQGYGLLRCQRWLDCENSVVRNSLRPCGLTFVSVQHPQSCSGVLAVEFFTNAVKNRPLRALGACAPSWRVCQSPISQNDLNYKRTHIKAPQDILFYVHLIVVLIRKDDVVPPQPVLPFVYRLATLSLILIAPRSVYPF